MTRDRCTAALMVGDAHGIPLAARCERDEGHPDGEDLFGEMHVINAGTDREYRWSDWLELVNR